MQGKILVVDDEKSIRITLGEFLRRDGYEVDIAESADKAMEIMKEESFDVVITDIIMPRISGVELLNTIKKQSPEVQVIIMTGEPAVETAIQAVQAGAYDYICKPVTKNTLLKVVGQAVQVRTLLKEKEELEKENHRYQENLELLVDARTRQLQKAMQSTIFMLGSLLNLRDPYTASHQLRVGNLAAAIGKEMGLPVNIIEGLRVTGYLHDIGKIAIPAEILVKPGKLSLLEFEIVKTHAIQGYEILKEMEIPFPIAQVAVQHHERYDGSGYPRGLKESEIMLESSVLIVADVVEAMSSHRPYRSSLGLEAALEEIEQNKGRLYNPYVVSSCQQLFRHKGYIISDSLERTNFLDMGCKVL